MPEKPVFWHFLEISSLVFSYFFSQRCVLGMPTTWLRPIYKKIVFPTENAGNMPKIAVFADFRWTFSLYFVVFSHKNIIDNNINHEEWFTFQ